MPPKHGLYTIAPTLGLLQYRKIQFYNEEASFLMGFAFLEKDS